MFKLAFLDIVGGLKKCHFWSYMAWQEILIRYRRSVLGPFWITVSTAIYVVAISTVFSALFHQDIRHYLLYMALGIMIWNYINQTIVETSDSFISCSGFIKQIPIEKTVFIYQAITRNIYFFLHNVVVLIICLLFLDSTLNLYTVSKAILGFCILTFNLFFVALTLSCLCTRFMDLRQIVLSILQIGMLVTPIMWIPTESMRTKVFILEWNPIYHFVDFIRMSLLPSDFPPAVIHPSLKYIIVFTLINMMVGFIVFAKTKKNISYWV